MSDMDGLEKELVPSNSTASPNFSYTGPGENDENDSSQDKMISKFQNQKKTVGKHFMSPTISAASKVAAPRKKILGESYGSSTTSLPRNHTNSNGDLTRNPLNSRIIHYDRFSSRIVSSCGHASESEDDADTKSLDGSSVKAYNPLTNYLSPRPKYLRFNPNRRLEILNRLDKEGIDDLISSPDSQEVNDEVESSAEVIGDSSFSPPKEGVVKPKNKEKTEEDDEDMIDDYEEDEEEFEEERGWFLRGALKLLLILIACLFSTSYICSMNSPTLSPAQQAIWNLKDGCLMIKKQTVEFISMKMHDTGFFEMEVGDSYGGVDEVERDEDSYGEIEESVEAEIVEESADEEFVEESAEAEFVEESAEAEFDEESADAEFDEESVDSEFDEESIEAEFVERSAGVEFDEEVDEAAELEGVRAVGVEFGDDKFEELVVAKTDEDIDDGSFCLKKEVESSLSGLNEDNLNGVEAAGIEVDESEYAGEYVLETEIEGSHEQHELELPVKSIPEEEPEEFKGVDHTEPQEELIGSHHKLTDFVGGVNEIGYRNEVKMEKVEWNGSTIFGVSLVTIVLTAVAITYHSRKARRQRTKKSRPVVKPHECPVEENITPVLHSMQKKVEFYARPPLSPHSLVEAPTELSHHIGAPTVELIGEIVVGKIDNLRISEKYEMTKYDKNNATRVATQPVSAPAQKKSALEYHTLNSPSYGSFTSGSFISKKEGEGRSGEATSGVTSLRRSSRLRNRAAVTSP